MKYRIAKPTIEMKNAIPSSVKRMAKPRRAMCNLVRIARLKALRYQLP